MGSAHMCNLLSCAYPSASRVSIYPSESLPPQSPFLAASGTFAMEKHSKEWNKPFSHTV